MTDFEVGIYRLDLNDAKYPDDQDHMGEYHTDGYEFFYYNGNGNGNWVDIGYGEPFDWDYHALVPLTEKYRELAEYEAAVRRHQDPTNEVTWGNVADDAKEWREYGL